MNLSLPNLHSPFAFAVNKMRATATCGLRLVLVGLLLGSFTYSTTCQSSAVNWQPSPATLACQHKVFNYTEHEENNPLDKPVDFDPSQPLATYGTAFEGVQLQQVQVFSSWTCGNGCDAEPKGQRGTSLLWVPNGATPDAPRVLFVHGGSWMYGSPTTLGYAPFAAKFARLLQVGPHNLYIRQFDNKTNNRCRS